MTVKSFVLGLSLLLATSAFAQTSVPPDVHVKLSLANSKSVYRMGEPIKLIMEFTADREGYVVEILPDANQPGHDTVVISPEFGVSHWLDEMTAAHRYPRDVFSTQNLSNVPQRVELILNDTLRFDIAGRYTVNVTTRRVSKRPITYSRPFSVTTNSVTFEVEPMSEADEAAEVKRLSDLLSAERDPGTDEEIGKLLSFLTGEPSTREKVRRFLNPEERSGNYHAHLWYGLFIARNRQLVLKLLEAGLRDPNTGVSSQLLNAVTRLRMLVTDGVRDKPVVVTSMMTPSDQAGSTSPSDELPCECPFGPYPKDAEEKPLLDAMLLDVPR